MALGPGRVPPAAPTSDGEVSRTATEHAVVGQAYSCGRVDSLRSARSSWFMFRLWLSGRAPAFFA